MTTTTTTRMRTRTRTRTTRMPSLRLVASTTSFSPPSPPPLFLTPKLLEPQDLKCTDSTNGELFSKPSLLRTTPNNQPTTLLYPICTMAIKFDK
ncbi:hypothetical protein M0802_004568 [Mischocyttarus mexicanus]|nr:hypothetical protein M0802_004568 [Mischocyttarus mexicanus]